MSHLTRRIVNRGLLRCVGLLGLRLSMVRYACLRGSEDRFWMRLSVIRLVGRLVGDVALMRLRVMAFGLILMLDCILNM